MRLGKIHHVYRARRSANTKRIVALIEVEILSESELPMTVVGQFAKDLQAAWDAEVTKEKTEAAAAATEAANTAASGNPVAFVGDADDLAAQDAAATDIGIPTLSSRLAGKTSAPAVTA